jgi:cytochrome c553
MKLKPTRRFAFAAMATYVLLSQFAASAAGTVANNAAQITRGAQLSSVCSGCHGADGNTANAELYPNLAAQNPDYIVLQLHNFKSGERPNAVMKAIATSLQEPDMLALAAYFGAQKAKRQPSADVTMEAKGRLIFAKGSAAGAPACLTCHGLQGQGQAVFPRIASQPAKYTLAQLAVYRDAAKFNNPLASEMKTVATKVNPDEMRAVAAYLATLQ